MSQTDALAAMIEKAKKNNDENAFLSALEMIRTMKNKDMNFIVPVEWSEDDMNKIGVGKTEGKPHVNMGSGLKLNISHSKGPDGNNWIVAFSSMEELRKGMPTFTAPAKVKGLLKMTMESGVTGIILNPFGTPMMINKELIQMLYTADKNEAKKED